MPPCVVVVLKHTLPAGHVSMAVGACLVSGMYRRLLGLRRTAAELFRLRGSKPERNFQPTGSILRITVDSMGNRLYPPEQGNECKSAIPLLQPLLYIALSPSQSDKDPRVHPPESYVANAQRIWLV